MARLSAWVDPQALIGTRERYRFVDGTWVIPGDPEPSVTGVIPGAVFFDLGALKALPLTGQTPQEISQRFADLGLRHDDQIIVYDRLGTFSSPRIWWLLRRAGFEKVSVLNGGLPAWILAGGPVVSEFTRLPRAAMTPAPALVKEADMDDVKAAIGTSIQIVDARGAGRFSGAEPEPRAGLRSGHMPGALSLPFSALCKDGRLKPLPDIAQSVGAAGIDLSRPIITSCGSGVTAAGLALIFEELGAEDLAVYTGSWAQWGASDAPIDVG